MTKVGIYKNPNYAKEWREKNKEKLAAYHRRKNQENPEYMQNVKLKIRYNITLMDRKRMEAAQDGKCKICKEAGKLYVDHCHATGLVRALLCFKCNAGLGSFGDKPKLLEAAILYLKTHKL